MSLPQRDVEQQLEPAVPGGVPQEPGHRTFQRGPGPGEAESCVLPPSGEVSQQVKDMWEATPEPPPCPSRCKSMAAPQVTQDAPCGPIRKPAWERESPRSGLAQPGCHPTTPSHDLKARGGPVRAEERE